jgi:hypothetical protein
MLDTTMLQIMGLMDHPIILETERQRIQDEQDKKTILGLVEKCMKNESLREALKFNDQDLAELFIAAEVAERNAK